MFDKETFLQAAVSRHGWSAKLAKGALGETFDRLVQAAAEDVSVRGCPGEGGAGAEHHGTGHRPLVPTPQPRAPSGLKALAGTLKRRIRGGKGGGGGDDDAGGAGDVPGTAVPCPRLSEEDINRIGAPHTLKPTRPKRTCYMLESVMECLHSPREYAHPRSHYVHSPFLRAHVDSAARGPRAADRRTAGGTSQRHPRLPLSGPVCAWMGATTVVG